MKIKKTSGDTEQVIEEKATLKGSDIASILAAIEKKHGQGSICLLGAKGGIPNVEVISTGSLLIDGATGIGGLPRGRVIEFFGPESCGKTTLALSTIAQGQKAGHRCAFIDAEHALSRDLTTGIGVNIDDLVLSQPDYGEQALDIVEMLASSGTFSIIAVDSVAALVPKAEIDGDMGDSHMGLQARLMGQALRKLSGLIAKTNTMLIFVNQLRQKIGVVFGPNETTPGGNALKFWASVRMDIRRVGALKKGEEVIGNRVKVKVVKNKLAPPFREIETDLTFGKGFDIVGEVLDIASEKGIVAKSGAWYSYRDERIGQGRSDSIAFLREHTNVYETILADIQIGV